MAVRHASGAYLQRFTSGSTDGIPQQSGGFICGWFVTRGLRSGCLLLLRGEGTTGQYFGIYMPASGSVLTYQSTWGSGEIGLGAPIARAVGVGLALSPNLITAWAYSPTAVPAITPVNIGAGDPQFNMVRVGDDGYGAWYNGESHGVMAFGRQMGAGEIDRQIRYRAPLNRDGLLFWLPESGATPAEDARDYSSFGRNFSVIGSPTAGTGVSGPGWIDTP